MRVRVTFKCLDNLGQLRFRREAHVVVQHDNNLAAGFPYAGVTTTTRAEVSGELDEPELGTVALKSLANSVLRVVVYYDDFSIAVILI
jgi:hypothetical protein